MTFFYDLMEGVRNSIENGTFGKYRKDIKALYPESNPSGTDDEEHSKRRDAAKRQGNQRFAQRAAQKETKSEGGRSGGRSNRHSSRGKDSSKGRGSRGKKKSPKR